MKHNLSPNPFSLDGQTALVTASVRGLGWAMAQALSQAGARVVLNGRDAQTLKSACAKLNQQGGNASYIQADLSNASGVEQLTQEFHANYKCDILVNNLGLRMRQPLDEFSAQQINDLIQANVNSPLLLAQNIAQSMKARGKGGSIISISSIAGPIVRKVDAVYPITKQAIEAMVRVLAVSYAAYGIRSNGIAPGTFATEANQAMLADPSISQPILQRNPMQRWAQPQEIGNVAVFLASSAASYINGQIITVDGGFSVNF